MLLVGIVALVSPALADIGLQDFSHRRHIIPGARSAMMGGAFTALSDDSSGLYFNPAGIVFGERKQEALGVLYSEFQQRSTFKQVINQEPFHENSKSRFASISGGIFRKGAFSFGYSFLTLDQRSLNQDDQMPDINPGSTSSNLSEYRRLHLENSNLTLVGGGGAYRINPNWSVGLAAFHFQRRNELMDYQLSRSTDNGLNSNIAKADTHNEGWLPNLGILYRTDSFGLGLSYQATHPTSSKTTITTLNIEYAANSETLQTLSDKVSSSIYREPIVRTYSLGGMLKPWSFLLFSTDLLYHSAEDHPLHLQNTINYSSAVELSLGPIRLNYAYFSNNSLFAPIKEGQSNQTAYVNFIGQSYGFSFVTSPVDISFAMIEQVGAGQAQVIVDSYEINAVVSHTRQFFVAVNYRL